MKSISKWVTPAAAFLVLAATGCSVTKQDAGTFRTPIEDRGRVVTDASAFTNINPIRVTFEDFREFEEYSLFRSERGQAEMLFIEIPERRSQNHILDFSKLVSSAVQMWRFNQETDLKFEPSVSVTNNLGDFWIRRYQQVATGRSCVGFVGTWDLNFSDPSIRPTKALFGYYCQPSGNALSQQDAKRFVTSIDIRGISVPLQIETAYALSKEATPPPSREEQVASLVAAQDGIAGGISGLPAFPLLVARSFPIGDSCPAIQC